MGYALRSDEHYTGLRPREAWAYDLISHRLFHQRLNRPARPEKTLIRVDVAGQSIRLESTETQLPTPVAQSLSRISDLAEFEADWNSYGALPLQPSVVEPAIRLILAAFPRCIQPEISLTPAGGLCLFWHRGPRELEVEIHPDGSCDYAFEDKATGEERAPILPVRCAEVQEFLGDIFR